ncbi:MAG TPA: DUF1289 domain-containing protein [Gammaproteobacteria bacterium]|nr:DUF1289 domain-containing protein [Gammaproteobacteria bacterium]
MAVVSPCVRNCCLDKQDVCIGCGRTVEEIIRWGDAGDTEKLSILKNATKRIKRRKIENNSDK